MSAKAKTILGHLDAAGRLIENIFLVALLGGMMLLSVAQIIARELFNTGLYWSGDIISIMVLWLAMVDAVAACRENRHIRIDALSHLLSDKMVGVSRLLVDLFAAAICATIAFYAWQWVKIEREDNETVLTDTPLWIVHLVVPVAFALLSYRFLIGIGRQFLDLKSSASEPGE